MATPKLFTSNRLELLARELAENLRAPLPSPFQPEIIVVQSQGMARWLKLELAREHGICANCIFPFPKSFSQWIFAPAFPEVAEESPFEPETLVWTILGQLPTQLDKPEFVRLKNYLGKDNDPRKVFQLSDKIARLFDQYLVFRPEMILEWDNGKQDGWQPILWREVVHALNQPCRSRREEAHPSLGERKLSLLTSAPTTRGNHSQHLSANAHPAALQKAFLEFATDPKVKFTGTAQRISIFGISALPKFYLEIFEALAEHTQLNLYLLQPCTQWWGYISSDRETEKTLKRLGKKSPAVSGFHIERGNRLLASLGQQGRDFLNLIHEFEWDQHDHSKDFANDSLLHCVQSDILNLRDRGMGDEEKCIVARHDTSIEVHNCHSPLREMEVLHDHMLDWFAKDPTLAPHDILVMTPDIELYAPFIQAVFESPEKESHRIPVSVADRGPRSQSQVIQTFLKILALPKTRLGATTVLSILESPMVR
ncbi:MAG TPA: exodeoxyribonuclease V subunit gamma, partial [Verrucomicrobiae bacterium]|nr:exodeoxyribonuclease V subunit gamma [Verrucomicrobiae bacterium]